MLKALETSALLAQRELCLEHLVSILPHYIGRCLVIMQPIVQYTYRPPIRPLVREAISSLRRHRLGRTVQLITFKNLHNDKKSIIKFFK